MEITILCIGDVVGKPGRSIVSQAVPRLVKERGIDCVIANVENAAAGSGLTELLYNKFIRYGVNLMTLGDHIYRKGEIMPVLERSECAVRPANYPSESVGKEIAIFETAKGPKVAVVSIMGDDGLRPPCDCTFNAADSVFAKLPRDVNIAIVDMHAEATSEKVAMGWYLNGRASMVFGTHTHIQTADERILDRGTAYITDLGMSGPYDSVLGRRKDRIMRYLMTGLPAPFDVATDDVRMCGALVKVDSDTGKATHIERIRVDADGASVADHDDD